MLDSGDLITAVRASMSLPGIFRTEVHGDQVLVDGGCVNPVPFDLLQDCDVSIGIDVQRDHEAATGETPNLFDAMFLTYQIMEESIIRSNLAHSLNKLSRHAMNCNLSCCRCYQTKTDRRDFTRV